MIVRALEGGEIEIGLDGAGPIARVSELRFDSEIFGCRIGRLEGLPREAAAAEAVAREAGEAGRRSGFAQLVSGRISADDHGRAQGLEAAGFRLADVSVLFERAKGDEKAPEAPDSIRPAANSDLPDLEQIAAAVFRGSRYYRDPRYPEAAADELHRRWIANSLAGRADTVLVEVGQRGRPIGFVTCAVGREREGVIELIGVDPAHRREGVAGRILLAALRWFAQRADLVRVRTQATNYAAARLYVGRGFRLVGADLMFSRWLTRGE